MNILKFLESLANEQTIESLKTPVSKRDSLSKLGKMGATAAVAAVPFSMLFSQKAAASTAAAAAVAETPTDALKLALTLEYIEDEFYRRGLAGTFLSAAQRTVIQQIAKHETAHVALLRSVLGNAAPAIPTFDFTAGGAFPTVFSDVNTFLAVAQALEDTGVRAYKGQAGNFPAAADKDALTTALQIHSVEARHASQIRRMRGFKGWIPGNGEGDHPAQANAVYAGENVTEQAGFNTASVPVTGGNRPIPAIAGSESFDEPLTTAEATAIAGLFIA
jgi:rubrerythrin